VAAAGVTDLAVIAAGMLMNGKALAFAERSRTSRRRPRCGTSVRYERARV
jgi:hypothetical protein